MIFLYRKWDLNPHDHYWSTDFKSVLSTDSNIPASPNKKACKGSQFFCIAQNSNGKLLKMFHFGIKIVLL